MNTAIVYRVCDTCTPAIVNADTSGVDPATAERIESLPYLVLSGEYDNGGYWDCEVCLEVTIGAGHTLQPLD